MVFNCKRLSIILCVLCLFLSSVYCQGPTFYPECRNESAKPLDVVTMTLNRQLLVPMNLMVRSSSGGTSWSNIDQLLNEAEAIILDLQADRDSWKQRALDIEAESDKLRVSLEKHKAVRNIWIGIGVSALTISVVTLLVCNN
jgi:hypothetical protein